MRKAFHLTLSQAGPSPETRLCWILVSFQRFPGLTSSTLPGGSGRHPSVRSHQLWRSVSGSCTRSEGCQGTAPDLPGSQSLLSQRAGFGLACPALLQTAEGLHQKSLRADSSGKQKVDSPRGMFSISRARAPPANSHSGCRTPPSQIRTVYPKNRGQLRLNFLRLSLGMAQNNYSATAVVPAGNSSAPSKTFFCAAWQSKHRKQRC